MSENSVLYNASIRAYTSQTNTHAICDWYAIIAFLILVLLNYIVSIAHNVSHIVAVFHHPEVQ